MTIALRSGSLPRHLHLLHVLTIFYGALANVTAIRHS